VHAADTQHSPLVASLRFAHFVAGKMMAFKTRSRTTTVEQINLASTLIEANGYLNIRALLCPNDLITSPSVYLGCRRSLKNPYSEVFTFLYILIAGFLHLLVRLTLKKLGMA